MTRLQDALISGVIGLVIAAVFTILVAQAIETPWDLGGALVAVAVASFFSGFFGRYYADETAV
jgi:hypothetical protein